MKKSNKIKLGIFLIVLIAIASFVIYLCVKYFFNDNYKVYLKDSTYETGTEFQPLKDSDTEVEGMELVAETDVLKLYLHMTTTEFAVYDKRTGEITYSNPVGRENDAIASGRNKVALNSQFMLTYYDSSMTQVTMYNYDYSVERNQFSFEKIQDGIRINYMLGNLNSPTGLVPPYITSERLETLVLSKLTEKEAKSIRNSYGESESLPGFLELMDGAKANKVRLAKSEKLFIQAGYTQELFDEDALMAAGGNQVERTTFSIPLEYRLLDDQLLVTIPTKEIKETGSGKLCNIDLLSYFAAGSTEDEGYIFVPNGSGSLIYFNNGKKVDQYNQYIYGLDEVAQNIIVIEDTEKIRMPIFGIKHKNSAIFAEITEGETLANLVSNVSGVINNYNYVYPSFLIRGSEKVNMFMNGASADLPSIEKDIYDLNIAVKYAFLPKEEANYSGMANYYRNQLMEVGVLTAKETRDNIPFYLDVIGGVKMQKSILGVPYLSVVPMTTVEDAHKMLDLLEEDDITRINMNYLGWFNAGYYHDVAKDISLDKKMGTKKEFTKLRERLEAQEGKLYGDVAFQRVSYESDNYNYRFENSQYFAGITVILGRKNPTSMGQMSSLGYMETIYHVLSPRYLADHVDGFIKDLHKVDLSGISFRDLGDMLQTDKRKSRIINRKEAKEIVLGQFDKLDEVMDHMMVAGGNAYAWSYADDILDAPTSHNPFYIIDEEIPFFEMVVHGSIDYTGTPINLSDNYDKQEVVLRMIEYGIAPRFVLSYEDTSVMKYSGLNSMFSTNYELWVDDAKEIYSKTNEALRYVSGSVITSHEKLATGFSKVQYDNGVTIYINNTKKEQIYGSIAVPAMSYLLEGVKE